MACCFESLARLTLSSLRYGRSPASNLSAANSSGTTSTAMRQLILLTWSDCGTTCPDAVRVCPSTVMVRPFWPRALAYSADLSTVLSTRYSPAASSIGFSPASCRAALNCDNGTYCTPSSAMLEFSSEPICSSVKPQASASCLFVKSLASHVSTWAEPVTRSSQSGMSDFIYAAVEPSLACHRL